MPPLLKEERQKLTLKVLKKHEQVTVTELSDRFDVSEVTIRRDLRELAERGQLRRAHGGALAVSSHPPSPPVIQRMDHEDEIKKQIGKAAANLIKDGDAVFLGSGSTTAYVARYLGDRKNVTVVTNAVNVANELAVAEDVTVVVTGGMMRHSELSLIGHIAEQSLKEVRVDKVMIGIPALSVHAGLTNDYLPEVMTDRTIIEMASELILVADSTKFGKVASAYVAPIERVSILVTDKETPAEKLTALQEKGIRVIVTDADRNQSGDKE